MTSLIGVLCFQHAIPCRGDALGCRFHTIIDGVHVQLLFPDLKLVGESGNGDFCEYYVAAPSSLDIADEEHMWGYVVKYNLRNPNDRTQVGAKINQIAILCQVEDESIEIIGEQLGKSINNWRSQLYERLLLSGKSISDLDIPDFFERNGKATGFHLFKLPEYSIVQTNGTFEFSSYINDDQDFVTPGEWQKALNEIDLSKHLKTEYVMYLNALVAQTQCDTRRAIMEATTAAELCITQMIQCRCNELGINGTGLCDALYRSLGDRFNLLKYLNLPLATTDPSKEIVRPRNDLFHNRKLIPPMEDCNMVLKAVKAYLNAYMPDMYE